MLALHFEIDHVSQLDLVALAARHGIIANWADATLAGMAGITGVEQTALHYAHAERTKKEEKKCIYHWVSAARLDPEFEVQWKPRDARHGVIANWAHMALAA